MKLALAGRNVSRMGKYPVLHTATIDALRSWEQEFPVESWRIGDLAVWPLLRIRLASRMLEVGRPPVAPVQRSLAAPLTALKTLRLFDRARPNDGTPREAVFLSRPANRQFVNGRWYDRLLDPIADALEMQGSRVLQLEYRTAGSAYRLPRYRPAVSIRAAVTRRNVAAALHFTAAPPFDGFDAFVRTVRRSQPAIRIPSARWVAQYAHAIDQIARDFERILERARARIVFTCVYYTQVGMALCLAARRRNIPAVDVQHGVTAGNSAYESWSRFPNDGFSLLPSVFWCWSDEDARAVNGWPAHVRPAHRTVVGGHPWFAVWGSGQSLVRELDGLVPDRGGASLVVLVTLSWSSGLSDRLKRVIAASPPSWRWWLRLHPLMDRARPEVVAWSHTQGGRVVVDQATDLPLPRLLERADVHLTHNSTVVQEASRVGTPSVVIDSRALDVYTEELASGWAVFADEPGAICAAIVSQAARRASLVPRSPYPSWTELTRVVHDLVPQKSSCLDTAHAASSPTVAQA